MNKKLLIGIGIVLLVVVVFVAGFFFWNFINPNTIKKDEKAEVTALVENFGLKLKEVSLSDPRKEIVSQEIKQVYTPFVSSNFLLDLIYDPSKAPGRVASSPWPERIEIISLDKLNAHTIKVKGIIILMTSVEMTQGGNAGEDPIVLVLRDNEYSEWRIDELWYGDYAFYDGKKLYNILKNAFPNMGIIGGRGEPFVAQSIDITGDYVPEAIVDMQTGGAYVEYYTVCRFVSGKLEVAQFKDKNGNVSTMFIYEGASVQHEVKLSFINDGKGNHAIYQYTINKSASDPTVISTITVEAYKWNEATKLFEYNEELSIEFEQEEEKLLMPQIVAFSSLKYKEIKSSFPIITSVSVFNGKVAFATGTGKIIVNDFKAANTNHLVIYDAQSGKLEYSTSIDKSWARISGVQMNDNWVLFEAMEDPGEIPSECFAINRKTNRLIKLLPNYSWGGNPSPTTTVFTVFDRTLLQGDYAYLVIRSEEMVVSGYSTSFRGGVGGTRFVRVNLNDGKQDSIFTTTMQSFSISQLWGLDNDSVAFSASEVLATGDIKDYVYFYDPSTATPKPVIIDQWKGSSDPNYIGTYTLTPDRRIIYSSNNKIVIAPVATLGASTEVGIAASHDYISDYIVASNDYIVARLDNGDIFVLNRKTGERIPIKGAKVKGTIITINADEISFINRQEKANDSIIYLDLKELSNLQPTN